MRLITLLNHCQHFPGFVYEKARLCPESSTIEIRVRPRRGSKPVCSGCHKPAAGYDQLSIRRFEFVPFWGFMVLLIYRMRRVDCRACGVRVEELPWAIGKHQLTKAYMLFLAHWARKLSWQETAVAFRSTWDKVCQAVEYVVEWGLEHRNLGPIQAIGVDEIQYAKGHKYLTLVYQIEKDCTRLLWIGKDRTIESFEQFFTLIGEPLSEGIKFVCSDMWQPYLRVIRERCTNAVNILDRFHIVAKMNEALDDVRAAEARRLVQDGYEPVLKKTRWCVLKRKANLQRRYRGLEQQGKTNNEKSLWIPNFPGYRTRPISRTGKTTRAKRCPQILLTNPFSRLPNVVQSLSNKSISVPYVTEISNIFGWLS